MPYAALPKNLDTVGGRILKENPRAPARGSSKPRMRRPHLAVGVSDRKPLERDAPYPIEPRRQRQPGIPSPTTLILRANGSFPKGTRRLSEKSPARHPPPHRRDGIAWERGRPARILSLWPPLSFSAMLQAATLSAGTASARPKESRGAGPG